MGTTATMGQPAPTRLAALRADAAGIGRLVDETIVLPRAGRTMVLVRPGDMDELLDRAVGDPEQNLPYWCEIWPSGVALADAILTEPGHVADGPVLELGSGLGITAAAALLAGADLVAADYAPEALGLCRLNCLANAGREPETLTLNWRRPGDDLFNLAGDGFPTVLAADVLYESRDVGPLLDLVGRLVAPGGLLWLAEPGRPPATRFLEAAREAGWHGETTRHPGPWPDPKDAGAVVGLHALRRR